MKMNNWKTLKEETPTECSICLITVNGNVTLATYSEAKRLLNVFFTLAVSKPTNPPTANL